MSVKNPFEYEAANKFTVEEMVDYFIPDENYTRFLASRKNVFLMGDRGTGKTMALRFYSLPVQHCSSHRKNLHDDNIYATIGIYVPCRRPSLGKTEPQILDSFLGRLHGEHFLISNIIASLADSLAAVGANPSEDEEKALRHDIPFLLNWQLPSDRPFFPALGAAARRESIQAQKALNKRTVDSCYDNIATFATTFQPLTEILNASVSFLRESHFNVMFDDAEDLSDHQNETLNSWIAVRDTSRISFKVATSATEKRPLQTTGGGGLLERHDFLYVNLDKEFQSSDAEYGKMARKIMMRRLNRIGLNISADEFFPANPEFSRDLDAAEKRAREEAVKRGYTGRQITDFAYKMGRAYYFRDRPPQANRPPYSGFDLLVHVSTGVIRYLLEPCYQMYDAALSESLDKAVPIRVIPSAIQTACLQDLSKRRWEWIKGGFNSSIKGCTSEDAKRVYQLLDQVAALFRKRLERHESEPRAISFSISGHSSLPASKSVELEHLLLVARRAQILFTRTSTSKDEGGLETYYTFDRLLWISRGLDPVGQNARVSIGAVFLWKAAFENEPLPFNKDEKRATDDHSQTHFTSLLPGQI